MRSRRENLERAEGIEARARELYEQFKDAGVTWAAAVQAVKTDWVAQFVVKWSAKMSALKSTETT